MSDLNRHLAALIDQYGTEVVSDALKKEAAKQLEVSTCTILVNRGVHNFPAYLFSSSYIFTVYEGSLDLSSDAALDEFVSERLVDLAKFLLGRKWKHIDLVISGHAAVCMQVKLLVYRITHVETTDWVFDGSGNYLPLKIPLRRLINRAEREQRTFPGISG